MGLHLDQSVSVQIRKHCYFFGKVLGLLVRPVFIATGLNSKSYLIVIKKAIFISIKSADGSKSIIILTFVSFKKQRYIKEN